MPKDKPWLVNLMDKDKIRKDITEARKHADVVMVFPHWGTENSHKVSDYQKEYTKLFSDLGVDIVIGSHPHVLQPVAWVTNEKSGKKCWSTTPWVILSATRSICPNCAAVWRR